MAEIGLDGPGVDAPGLERLPGFALTLAIRIRQASLVDHQATFFPPRGNSGGGRPFF